MEMAHETDNINVDIEGIDDENNTEALEESIDETSYKAEKNEETRDDYTNQKQKLLRLPLSRVKAIMKLDPQVDIVSFEATFLVTKATELFIEYLTKQAEKHLSAVKRKTMMKKDINNAIDRDAVLCFLDGAME